MRFISIALAVIVASCMPAVAFAKPSRNMLRAFNKEFNKLDSKNRRCKLPKWTRSYRRQVKSAFLADIEQSLTTLRFKNKSDILAKKLFSGKLTCVSILRGICAWELEFDLNHKINNGKGNKLPSEVCYILHQWNRKGSVDQECIGLLKSSESRAYLLQGFKTKPPKAWYREKCGYRTVSMLLLLETIVRTSRTN
jgi:hypothetical protein